MILLDTGVLYAGADQDDRHHRACAELLATHVGPLLVPVPVIARRLGSSRPTSARPPRPPSCARSAVLGSAGLTSSTPTGTGWRSWSRPMPISTWAVSVMDVAENGLLGELSDEQASSPVERSFRSVRHTTISMMWSERSTARAEDSLGAAPMSMVSSSHSLGVWAATPDISERGTRAPVNRPEPSSMVA